MKKRKLGVFDITLIAMFAALTAVCSWISLPVFTVPVTLQTFAVFCCLLILKGRNGTLAIAVYILLGLVGVPVFSGFKGGASALFGLTGGYIIGFIFIAFIYSLFTHFFKNKPIVEIASLILGLLVCYLFGTLWFMFIYGKDTGKISFISAVSMCVLPFIIPDLIKLAAAFGLSKALNPIIRKTEI